MRIGVDVSAWNNNRGFGRFTRELVRAMTAQDRRNGYVLLTDDPGFPDAQEFGPRVEVAAARVGRRTIEAATAESRRSVRDMLALRRVAAGSRLDLMFYPAVYSWYPPPSGVPSVVTFHDAIAERFPELVFPHRRGRLAWGAKTLLARRTARSVLTVSEAAKREIVTYLGIPAARIEVITEGAGAVFAPVTDAGRRGAVRAEFGIPAEARLLVYVGGFAPHKNLARLIDAFADLADAEGCRDLALVMAGDPAGGGFHSDYEQLGARVAGAPVLRDRVHFIGYAPDEALAALYSDALALVLPSLSEGFGLPALEAMSCGAPVLAAHGGAVLEVAGQAGFGFDPLDVGEIAAAIAMLATRPELAERLAGHAIAESRRHGWDRGAELTIAALERAAGGAACGS